MNRAPFLPVSDNTRVPWLWFLPVLTDSHYTRQLPSILHVSPSQCEAPLVGIPEGQLPILPTVFRRP